MDLVGGFLSVNGYLPHGHCFTWTPALLWSMVVADGVIALSYFSIPAVIVSFYAKRPDLQYRGVAALFGLFIMACGVTHLMAIWTIWVPQYGLEAITKVFTAGVSLITAAALWPLLPKALKIPSVQQLQQAITSLEGEIRRRKTAEEHLHDTEQSLSATLNSIGAGFIRLDAQGRISRINEAALALVGLEPVQVQGLHISQVLVQDAASPVFKPELFDSVGKLLERGQTHHLTLRRTGGAFASVELKASPTVTPDGAPSGATLLLRDMTALRDTQAELNRLAAIVESSGDAIISKTLDGRITSWNQGAQEIFGHSAEEAIGQSALILIPPDRAQEEMDILASLASGRRVPHFNTVRKTKDGRLIDVNVTISPILDARGQVVGGSKIARDITQQREAEQARLKSETLEAENRQIQETSRVKSLFLANMSHELRTPLNSIIGFAELLEAGAVPADSPRHQQFLSNISRSGQHLLRLINDVLDLSKVDAGKLAFTPQPVRIEDTVEEVLSGMGTEIAAKSLQVTRELDPAIGVVEIDEGRFRQVLYNYLSNAIKFTPNSGAIAVRALPAGPDHFRVEVQDSGAGISAEDIGRLFVEFQQLDSSFTRKHQGTGLGLALTRRMVEAQGGSVGVSSTVGQGSTFHLVLPRLTQPIDPQ